MRNNPEILAPVGGREQLTAAVACGADAVYFGAATLNARRGASNFAGDALREAVEYCHLRGVKVHLTMNTVVLERELGEAAALAEEACGLGVDAVIVQDLGLARMLRAMAPGLTLHASTQMAVHNLSGAMMLEELGFRRVVLAREMSAREIAEVVRGTCLETEVFVHGALCMCVSGQCYMSSMIGERSGNRGLCAQPCRLPFYVREQGRCGLSLRDLSLVERLEELRDMGVSSVKIEGRMKRPEYVAAAVTACKQALNGEKPDLERLQAVFSRSGFTNGYYTGRLGTEMFGTRQKEDVVSAAPVLGEFAQLYRKETPRVPLDAEFTLKAGEPAALRLADRDGNAACARGETPQEALHKPTTAEMVEQQLRKLGGTPYFLDNLSAVLEEGLVLPVSQLNALRREAVEELSRQRTMPEAIACTSCKEEPWQDAVRSGPPPLRARFARIGQVPGDCSALERIHLPPAEALKAEDPELIRKLAVELPRIDFEDYRVVRPLLEKLRQRGVTRALAGNLGAVWLAKELGFAVTGDWALNLTNSRALAQAADLGCAEATVSWELNLNDIKRLRSPIPFGIVAYGSLPLMIMRNCPAKQEQDCARCPGIVRMTDRKGNRFPVGCGGSRKLAEVYNCVPLYLADRLRELEGLSFLTLFFTGETQAECAQVIGDYQHGGKRENCTRGLYYRNIL